jgi:hypothetical protein
VIVLSQHVETEHLFELLAGDPRGIGYVLKERVADIAQFTGAIRRVAAGESVIDPQVVGRLVARPRKDSPLETLTERELAALALMAEGRRPAARSRRPPQGPGRPDLPTPVAPVQRGWPPHTASPDPPAKMIITVPAQPQHGFRLAARAWPGLAASEARASAPTATRFSGRCGKHPHPFGSINNISPNVCTLRQQPQPLLQGRGPGLKGCLSEQTPTPRRHPGGRAPARSDHCIVMESTEGALQFLRIV